MSKKGKFTEDAIDKMFEIAAYEERFKDIKDSEEMWMQQYTMTPEQENKWKGWFISEIKNRDIVTNKTMAELAWEGFNLNYGLKISDG